MIINIKKRKLIHNQKKMTFLIIKKVKILHKLLWIGKKIAQNLMIVKIILNLTSQKFLKHISQKEHQRFLIAKLIGYHRL